MSISKYVLGFAGLAMLSALLAQPMASTAYTITQTSSMFGGNMLTTTYRNGSQAVTDSTITTSEAGAKPSRHITLVNIPAQTSVTWNPSDSSEGCGSGSFTNDSWGDPFKTSAETLAEAAQKGAKRTGADTVNGIATQVLEATMPDGKIKV